MHISPKNHPPSNSGCSLLALAALLLASPRRYSHDSVRSETQNLPTKRERLVVFVITATILFVQVVVATFQYISVASLANLGEARANQIRREEMIRALYEPHGHIRVKMQVLSDFIAFERGTRKSKAFIDLARVDLSCTGNHKRDCFRSEGINLKQIDFTGARFRGASLSNADFSRSILQGADFSGADLHNARLRKLNLDRSKFNSADLRGADLSEASMILADLTLARLDGASISGARFRNKLKLAYSLPLSSMRDLILLRQAAVGIKSNSVTALESAINIKRFFVAEETLARFKEFDTADARFIPIDPNLLGDLDAITSAAIVDRTIWGLLLRKQKEAPIADSTLFPFSSQQVSEMGRTP